MLLRWEKLQFAKTNHLKNVFCEETFWHFFHDEPGCEYVWTTWLCSCDGKITICKILHFDSEIGAVIFLFCNFFQRTHQVIKSRIAVFPPLLESCPPTPPTQRSRCCPPSCPTRRRGKNPVTRRRRCIKSVKKSYFDSQIGAVIFFAFYIFFSELTQWSSLELQSSPLSSKVVAPLPQLKRVGVAPLLA